MAGRRRYSSITLEEFGQLPASEQVQHVWDNGRYLMNREDQRAVANLYAVGAFCIEI